MNDLIERYIYDVTRRLPEKERGEIKRELEASITDMLPDNPNLQEITEVLTKLGEPRIIAEQYRQKPQYLISPALFDLYISVLKTVTITIAIVCACIGAFIALTSGMVGNFIESTTGSVDGVVKNSISLFSGLIENTLGMAIEGAIQAVIWVTIGFVIAEKCGYRRAAWTVDDLPKFPAQDGVSISRSSALVGMVLTVFFTALFVMMIVRNEFFFVFVRNSEIINPFSQEALLRFIPYLIILAIMSLIVDGFKLLWTRWNVPLCVINAIHNIAWVSIIVSILHWSDLFSVEFRSFAEQTFTAKFDIMSYISTGGTVTILSGILILAAVIDSVVGGWNTWKGLRGLS